MARYYTPTGDEDKGLWKPIIDRFEVVEERLRKLEDPEYAEMKRIEELVELLKPDEVNNSNHSDPERYFMWRLKTAEEVAEYYRKKLQALKGEG